MLNLLKILVVEDDINTCNSFQKIIEMETEFELAGITDNSKNAISLIKDRLPNVVILDLELHSGGGNGIEVLQTIQGLQLPVIPFFLITTNNTSTITYDTARILGADFIMYKHEEGYSERCVIDLLKAMSNIILKNSKNNVPVNETPYHKSQKLKNRIHSQLDLIGISPKLKGYDYLTDAILLVYHGECYNICSKIGSEYGKTSSSVERAMQNAINIAWRSNDINVLLKYYTAKISSDKGTPTITEFIHYYSNIFKNEY